MFSPGQIAFSIFFILAFATVLVVVYRRDRQWQNRQYKGVLWVFLSFVGFIIILLALKYFLKN